MHYSQIRKIQGNKARTPHPGTPRPITRGESNSSVNSQLNDKKPSAPKIEIPSTASVSVSLNKTKSLVEVLPDFLIWVKNDPFDFGILSNLASPKIGINILRKVAVYCRDKPSHYPELSLNQWHHISKYKIQLVNDLCYAYFRMFDILIRPASMWSETVSLATRQSNYVDPPTNTMDGIDDMKDDNAAEEDNLDVKFQRALKQGYDNADEFKVDTLQFLLFLYLQHFLRLHKKYASRSCAEDETWPKFWSTKGNSSKRPNSHTVPEQTHAEFLMANLGEIIDFLMVVAGEIPGTGVSSTHFKATNQLGNGDLDDHRVSINVIKALSFILGAASTSLDREFRSLDECLVITQIAKQVDYNKSNLTVDKQRFVNWIKKHLKLNPWSHSSIPIPQVPVSATTGVCEVAESCKGNKIYWNTQCYPKAWFLVSGIDKQVLLLDSIEAMSSIKIHRCTSSYIYITGVHNMILVQKCHDVTLNLGVATKVVKIMDCSNITVTAVGRLCIICDVVQSTFHLLTSSNPIIYGAKNRNIVIAPYNTTYPNLSIHMKMAGITTKLQKWNKPLEISGDGILHDKTLPSNFSLMRPEQFHMALFPFKSNDDSIIKQIPGILPLAFQRRLDAISETLEKVKTEYATKMISEDDSALIYQITLQRLKKWLKDSGNYEEIVGLRSFQKSIDQQSKSPVACNKGHDLACVSKSLRQFLNSSSSPSRLTKTKCYDVGVSKSKHKNNNLKSEQKSSENILLHTNASNTKAFGAGENPDENFRKPEKLKFSKASMRQFVS